MKPKLRKGKGKVEDDMCVSPAVGLFPGDDGMLLVKDVRSSSRRKKPPSSSSSHLSRSWPCELRNSKKHGSVPGGKKKHRKELIAIKRQQRMINRGVDLDQINSKLRQLVMAKWIYTHFNLCDPCDDWHRFIIYEVAAKVQARKASIPYNDVSLMYHFFQLCDGDSNCANMFAVLKLTKFDFISF
uniref:Uncharacterized protein n=1 Tax=Ananas comosus var. bracteatus TaxID=296719 RepID=A0A6V7PMM3_ANACO|nr:unnamed protein product [Ananas comosus var. bracteatus]